MSERSVKKCEQVQNFATREEVPPTLLFLEEKLVGDWVSQST